MRIRKPRTLSLKPSSPGTLCPTLTLNVTRDGKPFLYVSIPPNGGSTDDRTLMRWFAREILKATEKKQ